MALCAQTGCCPKSKSTFVPWRVFKLSLKEAIPERDPVDMWADSVRLASAGSA